MAESGGDKLQRPSGINFNTVMALCFIAAAIALYFLIPLQIEQPRFTIGNAVDPELFPRLVALTVFGLGIIYFLLSFRMTETNLFAELNREAVMSVMVTILVTVLYVFVVVGDTVGRHIGVDFGDIKIGFVIPSAILIFFLSSFYGNRHWVLGLAISIIVPVAIYLSFTKFLLQRLPDSPLTEWGYRQLLTLLG